MYGICRKNKIVESEKYDMKIVIDTSALIQCQNRLDELVEGNELIVTTTVSSELDNMKESDSRGRAFNGRTGLRWIQKNEDILTFVISDMVKGLPEEFELDKNNNDNRIISAAIVADASIITVDRGMRIKCKALGIDVIEVEDNNGEELYKGYTEFEPTDEDWVIKSEGKKIKNTYGLVNGEYGVLMSDGVPKAVTKCEKNKLVELKSVPLQSRMLGNFHPKDLYQIAAMDSLMNNDMTFLTGKAGTGKTLLSLSYLIWALEKGEIEKIYIVHNPVPTRDAQQIGYLKGSMMEKILGSSLGGILVSKFGGMQPVENMINFGQLEIIPMSSIRGMEIRKNQALYITESQNLSRYLAKTAIQRCATGSKVVFEGDTLQSDSSAFDGGNNGFQGAINVFKGISGVGTIELKNIYRNKFTEIAELI